MIRRQISHEIAKTALKASLSSDFVIDSVDGVDLFFGELCDTIIRNQKDGDLFGTRGPMLENKPENDIKLEWEDIVEEQSLVSRLIQLIKSSNGAANDEFTVFSISKLLVTHCS